MKLQITLTQGQYDHLYNIMCSQDEIIDYLNESEDFDVKHLITYLIENLCRKRRQFNV